MSCRSLGRHHLSLRWRPLLRGMALAHGLWRDSLRADSAVSNGLNPVALALPVCTLGCLMSCHGLKCATSEHGNPCVARMHTCGSSVSCHGLKCAESCDPCVAGKHTRGGSKFFHELKCKSSRGGKRGTGDLGRGRTGYAASKMSWAASAVAIGARGAKTIIGGVAKVEVDHARVQDGSPIDGLSSTRLVL